MSYILDALKKSDMQARRGGLPSIHSSHTASLRNGRRPGWQYVLFGCAASGLVLGSAYFLFPGTADNNAQISATTQSEPTVSSPLSATTRQAAPLAGSLPVVNNVPPPARPSAAQTDTTPPAVQQTVAGRSTQAAISSTTPVNQTPAPPTQPASRPGAQAALAMPDIAIGSSRDSPPPLRNKLPLSVQQSLPSIDISGHIFDEQPGARMVFINGHIQREGDSISPGLSLLAITPTGVELSYRGTAFRINLFQSRFQSSN